ncbi:hypothetical protein [Sessilibacter corallicola]|uniref:hypothetical protein n=1 Tax=Sessilibacter corallicola TaxID=2904075 RepID=UPI001E403154|nr:hypothetical protein [Sessilibacter corallicola]MCE2029816.1 hypothetical protein [Sessilibacter corallicola]
MSKEYTTNLVEIATHGFEAIDPNETVEVNLKDLMYVFSTLQEYQRFFHQPLHYQSLEDVEQFLGSVDDTAGFKLLHTAIHEKMRDMLPKHINDKYGEGDFDSPKIPFYYNTNR